MRLRPNLSLTIFLWEQLKRFFPYYFGAILSLFLLHYIQSNLPFYAQELGELVSKGAESFETKKFFLLALGIIIFRTSSRLLFFYPARVMERDVRVELLEKLESTSPLRYKEFPAGQIFQRIYADTEQMRALVGFALLQIGNVIIALSVLIPKIIEFNSELIKAIIPMGISSFLFALIVSRNRKYHKKVMDLQGEVQNFILESYSGKTTIQNYNSEKSFIDLFKSNSIKELLNFYKAGVGVSVSFPLVPLGVGLSLIYGASIISEQGMDASALIAFSGFTFLFLEPLAFISWIGIVFVASVASYGRIMELVNKLNIKSEKEDFFKEQLDVSKSLDQYDFKVNFWEKELNLKSYKNKWNVLIGKTGVGKTEVLFQMAEVLKENNIKLSMVGQAPYIYSDTIQNNIFLGHEVSEDDLNRAYDLLKLFGLDHLASSKDELLNLDVGEDGKRISGGQAKRLCLIRSLISDADVYIWDDPFSSVDLILEKDIFEKLKVSDLVKDKTFIISSHRITTVKQSDYIILLDKEKGILEEGEQVNLLSQNSKFYEYFEKQMV